MLIILFGKIGSGKTYIGKILEAKLGWYFCDGDASLPETMKQTLLASKTITQEMRDEFFSQILQTTKRLYAINKNLILAQTFIKQKYRDEFAKEFSDVLFFYISADQRVRIKRISKRATFSLDEVYIKHMDKQFDVPRLKSIRLDNSQDGEEYVKSELERLIGHGE